MHVCLPKALIRRRGDKNNAFCFTWQLVCNIYQMSGECEERKGAEVLLVVERGEAGGRLSAETKLLVYLY